MASDSINPDELRGVNPEPDNSCWTCRRQYINAQDTLIGQCTAPAKNNPDRNKPIPGEVVDRGCKLWVEKAGNT
jgi:hypothetical protein